MYAYEYQAEINRMKEENERLRNQLNGKWIPVSERLPEVFEYVLVTSNEGGRTIAHRMPNQTTWYDLHSTIVETGVIAWQQPPEPYIEKERE